MANALIIQNKYDTLKEGYPVYINTDDIRTFTVEVGGGDVAFGSLLVKTAATKVYNAAQELAAGTITDENEIVGVAMATNVKLQQTFGASTIVDYKEGDQGDNMSKGEIAVQFYGTAPVENGKVYLLTDEGDQTGIADQVGRVHTATTAVGTEVYIELTNFRFSGITDTANSLTVLKKLY